MTQLDQLSHSRLVSRTTYYRDKALELGKQLAFTQEKISELNQKLETIQQEKEQLNLERDEMIQQYVQQLQELKEENKLLNEKLKAVQTNQVTKSHVAEQLEKKIEGYEKLLMDIQEEINKKEKEVDYYKSKVKSLEKRAYLSVPQIQIDHRKINTDESNQTNEHNLISFISYFDYLVLCQSEQKWIVRGDFHIKNTGKETLINPALCFRFSHPDQAAIKGKIISIDQASINKQTSQLSSTDWMFLESDWTKEAKERGEIWIVPTEEMIIPAGDTVTLHEFQIPVQKPLHDTWIVEGFVYFHDQSLKEKAVNHIMLAF